MEDLLLIEDANSEFTQWSVRKCVVVPQGWLGTLEQIAHKAVANDAHIADEVEEEAGDEKCVVKFGTGPQEALIEGKGKGRRCLEKYVVRIGRGVQMALTFFELEAALKKCAAPRRARKLQMK